MTRAGSSSTPGQIHLSKSRYTYGLQCPRLLWLQVHQPDAPELVPDEAALATMQQGIQIGKLARDYAPGGVLIDLPHEAMAERVAATERAIKSGARLIYEAAFLAEDVFVAVDILEKHETGWGIVEVKSSTSVKPEHLPDAGLQVYVLRRSGLEVTRAEIMHLNKDCTHPDLSNLFERTDVTAECEACVMGVPDEIEKLLEMLRGSIPEPEIDCHCNEPYRCPLKDGCWAGLSEHHVTTLYYGGRRVFQLIKEGYETIDELPEEHLRHQAAARQQRAIKAGRMIVEGDLAATLAAFRPPIAHLDFETINPAVPVWPGCHPYEQVPVQFSCYVERADGTLEHRSRVSK